MSVITPPVAAPAVPLVVNPPKIKTLTLCDFRAFAGPEPVTFHLDGKNLLIYGENGAGKSSVFHALDEFFALPSPLANSETRRSRLASLSNRFTQKIHCKVHNDFQDEFGVMQPAGSEIDVREVFALEALKSGALEEVSRYNTASVEVAFTDNSAAVRWDQASHPIDTATGGQQLVVNSAYRKAVLDYRSLLETNYRHGNGAVNLFEVCINILLRDYPVLHDGRQWRLFDLWMELIRLLDVEARGRTKLGKTEKPKVLALLPSINQGIRDAIAAVQPQINPFLKELGWDDIKIISLDFAGVTYRDRATIPPLQRIETKTIGVTLTFLGQPIDRPQNFLNEARLSALALAIYFSGRQASPTTQQDTTTRLIVLDDVLIGLDQSNRMPVLRMLDQQFDKWQIVLLTHDRVWYEMARFHLADQTKWAAVEMFEEKLPNGIPRPILRPANIDAIAANLATARRFHGLNEYAAAAVHARIAFELALKKLCERKSIPVRFKTDPRQLSSDELLTAIETWLNEASRIAMKPLIDPAIVSLKLWRKVVLNPFSHSTPVSLNAAEVQGAIDAAEKLHADFQQHIPK
ncbi:AAA family ATPase [Ochrobactrum quorumnocens]|uniref:AAA family ATPase n=1 Tax=Ochrobactrum quorumnocens TaxID=271865 RepID=A0A5N1JN78_9HYPH|nr:ATP-binding protein [[Ochrobactrum] quorumnocens]KAA9361446.1 AAA family ATPase [[Ochrobactrum] quorumnocens]